MRALFTLLLIALVDVSISASAKSITDSTEIWSAWSAEAELHVYLDTFDSIGVELLSADQNVADGERISFTDLNLGSLEFHAPAGNFESFLDGRLVLAADITLRHENNVVHIDRLAVQRNPSDKHGLILVDGKNRPLFSASHIHVYTQAERNMLILERMDIRMTSALAEALGLPEHAGKFIGELAMNALLHIPDGAKTDGRGSPQCDTRPHWSTDGFDTDVELIAIGFVDDTGEILENGKQFEVLTPSARLKNSSGPNAADVPWFEKFDGFFPPYNTDQHPYLIWNLYRIVDGRFEQIGVSGIKHAFFTINVSCDFNCGNGGIPGANGHILWPGCEDVYGVGNNDSDSHIGPRDGINPRTGVFVSTGSFFDQLPAGGDGVQDTNSSGSNEENRMKVWVEDLQTPGAEYLFESWYVIRDDVNIFNGMGYHSLTPNNIAGNSWQYSLGPFAQGRALDEWVAPGSSVTSNAMNVVYYDAAFGHVQVLARAEPTGDNRWRYTYVVKNYDVEHGIETFTVNTDVSTDSWYFHDPDHDDTNEWIVNQPIGQIEFTAPVGNPLNWGQAYSFGFVSDFEPTSTTIEVTAGPSAPSEPVVLNLLGPFTQDIFSDGFEETL